MTTSAQNAFGAPVSAVPTSKKASARAALIDVDDSSRSLLSDCFRQFGIEPVSLGAEGGGRLVREKFEACVVKIDSAAEPVLESVRTSPSNSRMVVYGLGGSVQQAMKFSRYGINAVFNEPLDRQSALKLVRSTQMLVFHEFRRYARIPVITEITVVAGTNRYTVSSQEISAGGMSIKSTEEIGAGQSVEVSFALLTLPRVCVRATVSWRKPGNKTFGIRFDPQDDRRLEIKKWVNAHLEAATLSS